MNEMKNEEKTAASTVTNERDAFEAWAQWYDLVAEPNYSEATKADCWAAWKARAALATTPAAGAPLDFLPFSARAAIASRHGMKVTAEFNALVREVIAEYRARAVPSDIAAAAPVVLPEPDAWLAVYEDRDGNSKFYTSTHKDLAVENDTNGKPQPLYTEQKVSALLAGVSAPAAHGRASVTPNSDKWKLVDGDMREAGDGLLTYHADAYREGLADGVLLATATGLPAQAVPDGWREQFAAEVYADLAAADNQDVPLEEYPARILKVLDAIVGPRHPTVVQWRNDAINACIAIAYKYCRDPESHKYLKQDLEAMLTAEPAPQAQALPYSLDLDPLGIRALAASAITGALSLGATGGVAPPAGHWLEWFYLAGAAAPQQADARDADGEAFRTAARLGLTLRFYGNCAQSGAPGTPSVYEVTTGPDSAEAMRASIDRAAIAAAKGQ